MNEVLYNVQSLMDLIRNDVTKGRLVLRYEESKNLSGEAYIQSSNTNLPGITKTSQKIERLSKTRALALDDCIFASPERFLDSS